MKRFGRTLLVSLLASAMIVTPVLAEPSVGDLTDSKKAAENEVSSLQKELQTLIEKMNTLEGNLIEKGEEIEKAETDLVAAEEKEQQQYHDMKLRIKYMYENGDGSFIETLLSAENFSDLLNKAEYVQNVHNYDRKMLKEYVATKNKITKLKTKLEKEMASMEDMQEEYKQEESSLNKTLNEKKKEVKDLDKQLQAAAEAAEKRRQEEEERRKEQEKENDKNHGGGNTPPSNSGGGNTPPSNNGGDNTPPSNGNDGNTEPPKDNGSSDNDNGSHGNGNAVVNGAARYLGVPYKWGGTSGSGVDCSGLVYLAHQAAGISVPRQSGALGSRGKAVSKPQPGDVVCYSGHVGIYVGGGQMIHAPEPGKVVCYSNINYAPHWFRRYW